MKSSQSLPRIAETALSYLIWVGLASAFFRFLSVHLPGKVQVVFHWLLIWVKGPLFVFSPGFDTISLLAQAIYHLTLLSIYSISVAQLKWRWLRLCILVASTWLFGWLYGNFVYKGMGP